MSDSRPKTARNNQPKKAASKEMHRLKASEAGFRSIFERVAIPLVTFDPDGKIDRYNRAFALLFELREKDLKGKSLFQTLSGLKADPRIKALVRAVFKGKAKTDIQWKVTSAKSAARNFAVSTFPIGDTRGQVSFGLAMFSDVTENKTLERALLHTEKMAAMGTLASGLAHEMGTPMNVILGRAETLLRHTQEEQTVKGLTIIIKQIDRMTQLIDRLLAFARTAPLERRQFDLNALINKSVELVGQQIEKKKVAVKTLLDPKLPAIWGDPDQIVQMMVNLLINALDALPSGGAISIKTARLTMRKTRLPLRPSHDKIKGAIRIVFEDRGSGIDPVHIDKIFDPFFTTKPVGKGTGLGLAVVSGIVRDHGGRIEVASLPGQGTTFTIDLPVGR